MEEIGGSDADLRVTVPWKLLGWREQRDDTGKVWSEDLRDMCACSPAPVPTHAA